MRGEHTSEHTFAVRLRTLRERAGLSQQELAERARLSPDAVGALERGARSRPYPSTVRSLADALGLSDSERAGLLASVPRRAGTQVSGSQRPGEHKHGRGERAQYLDVPPTRVYGREADLERVGRLFAGGARLVTLVGPGGVGKTRLAAALCDPLSARFTDAVVPVQLASLGEAADVVPTLARALGIATTESAVDVDDLAAHITDRLLLLVLDNAEHLLDAAPDLGRLVALCPALGMLVTSRSPLGLRAEQVYDVRPLELPPPDVTDAAALAVEPAGALILDRARAVCADFDTAPEQVRALAEVCHRLAGLPLAIELASVRLRTLPPTVLLERLDEALVSPGARDLPERQRTMRATLDWSYRLLTDEQQRLFAVLGAFRGGADLDAVEAVARTGASFDREAVLPTLEQLVVQSLVVVRHSDTGTPRFGMLEPVVQYARSLLAGADPTAVLRAHAEHYLGVARRAARGYERKEQVQWLDRIDDEEPNLLAAVEGSLAHGDADTAGLITWSMWLYWWLRHRPGVGRRMATLCLAHELSSDVRARVHLTAAASSYAGGEQQAAAEHWRAADRLGADLADLEVVAKARAGNGLVALGEGDLATARRCFLDTLSIGEQAGDSGTWIRSLAQVWLGTTFLLLGETSAAVEEAHRGLRLAQERGDRLSTYVALFTLSQAALASGEDLSARRHLLEGIRLSQETGDLANLAYFLESLSVLESRAGRGQRVALLLGAADRLREVAGGQVYGYYVPDAAMRAAAELTALDQLGPERYDSTVRAGSDMDLAEVVELALHDA